MEGGSYFRIRAATATHNGISRVFITRASLLVLLGVKEVRHGFLLDGMHSGHAEPSAVVGNIGVKFFPK